jgi:pyrimidine-specific ribonucleoside hydrolase
MILRILLIQLLVFSLFYGQIFAHSGNPKYHVIIDTDGAADDMRAVTMFLSGNDIRVLGITCSQGNLKPGTVRFKVRALLSAFHHEGIPTAAAEAFDFPLPAWAAFARQIDWGNSVDELPEHNEQTASELLTDLSKNYKEKITLIALGSLKTYAEWLKKEPESAQKIQRIIWYNAHDVEKGFNYKISPESFHYIKKTGISLEIVENRSKNLLVNNTFLKHLKQCPAIYAEQIASVHTNKLVQKKIKKEHLHLWDDLVPLYMSLPILFETKQADGLRLVELNPGLSPELVYEVICDLLISATTANNRVFETFPLDTALYKPAYAKILESTTQAYGLIEWKAISLTNEIHGHTGIYSIIGAKMGIRAMEYFNVGVNNLEVLSFAGYRPPLSCFNDGLQISSGATIGQGLITVSDSVSQIPSAVFSFNGRTVSISLKQNIAHEMQEQIQYGVKTYGLLTDSYWAYIERLALEYWQKYDRHEIFNYN